MKIKHKKKNKYLYSSPRNNILPTDDLKNLPLQHLTYNTIYKYRDLLKVDFNDKLKDLGWNITIEFNEGINMLI